MNPLYQKFLVGLLRRALQAGGPSTFVASDDELTKFVGAAMTVIGFVWGFWNDFTEQRKLNTAVSMNPTTLAHVEATIRAGGAASATTPKDRVPQ